MLFSNKYLYTCYKRHFGLITEKHVSETTMTTKKVRYNKLNELSFTVDPAIKK